MTTARVLGKFYIGVNGELIDKGTGRPVAATGGVPGAHAASHANGGADEINVGGLNGVLADAQPPAAHTHAQADVTSLVADLAAKVPTSRLISTTAPLAGGGDLSGDRTLTVGVATTTAVGVVELATDGESAPNVAVQGNDARMSNARTPTAHATSHQNGGSDEVATATAGANAIPKAGAGGTLAIGWVPLGTTSSTACVGNDARLSDARTPLSHAASHQNGGSDELSVTGLSGLLADGQTPLAHAASHQSGGSDAIKLDDVAAPDDNTDLNASASAHGLMQKYPGGTTTFLRADGAFAAPPGGGSDPPKGSYAPGSFTLETGKYAVMVKQLVLTTTQRATLEGDARLVLFA